MCSTFDNFWQGLVTGFAFAIGWVVGLGLIAAVFT